MAGEFWVETGRMAVAGAIVAAAVAPVGLLAFVLARRKDPHPPRPSVPYRVPWGGFEVLFAFLCVAIVPDLVLRAGVEKSAAAIVAAPIQLAILALGWLALYPRWRPEFSSHRTARSVALAISVWPVLTLAVLGINTVTTQVFAWFDWPMESHPLTKREKDTPGEQVLLLAQACLAAPLIEEILFRGIVLSWAIGGRERLAGGLPTPPLLPPVVRPLLVMLAGAVYAIGTGQWGPMLFAGVLTFGLGIVWAAARHGKRHARAVYASAAFFALIHSGVWPSPIPLLFLGLALGWLAVRTRGLAAPIVLHGLFNAVSAVYLLRGGS